MLDLAFIILFSSLFKFNSFSFFFSIHFLFRPTIAKVNLEKVSTVVNWNKENQLFHLRLIIFNSMFSFSQLFENRFKFKFLQWSEICWFKSCQSWPFLITCFNDICSNIGFWQLIMLGAHNLKARWYRNDCEEVSLGRLIISFKLFSNEQMIRKDQNCLNGHRPKWFEHK